MPGGLYSCFGIFLGIYINIKKTKKKTDLYDLNFVENEEWFEISWWTNGKWIMHNVSNIRWRILKKRTLIHRSNGQFFLSKTANFSCTTFPNFYIFLHFLYIHLHLTSLIIPLSPDDGSAELKRYSVDWLCFSINPHFLFGLFIVNFSSQIVGLLSIIFFHIYIYNWWWKPLLLIY